MRCAPAPRGIAAQTLGFFALSVLPLAEQTALGYTQPLFVTILAIPFLGEKVGIHRWSAVLLGFCGVLLIAVGQGVGFGAMPQALVPGTVAGVAHGHVLGGDDHVGAAALLDGELVHHRALAIAVDGSYAAVLLSFVWVTPSWGDLGLLILVLAGRRLRAMAADRGLGQRAVSAIAPYSYSALLWSIGLVAGLRRPAGRGDAGGVRLDRGGRAVHPASGVGPRRGQSKGSN